MTAITLRIRLTAESPFVARRLLRRLANADLSQGTIELSERDGALTAHITEGAHRSPGAERRDTQFSMTPPPATRHTEQPNATTKTSHENPLRRKDFTGTTRRSG